MTALRNNTAENVPRRPHLEATEGIRSRRQGGPRRQRLLDQFDAARPRWLSLDVFDTLLCRPFEKPTDVFFEVHRVLTEQGAVGCNAPHFAYLRIEAEIAARRLHPSGEITIEEIARELSRMLDGRIDVDTLVAAELATEKSFIQLDPDVAALVRHAAKRGVPYILVSDMYLRSEQLVELLRAAMASSGTALPLPEHVFVSGERRMNKGGRIFDTILQQLGCTPAEMFHVGDNSHADVEAPARRGIRTFHYFRETPLVARILEAESAHLEGPVNSYDFGLRTIRSKAVTTTLTGPEDELRHFHYGAFVLGPILTLFAEWVVRDCVERGQNVVFCLMREGHLLAPLIEKAARAMGADLEARPLWASRYAIRAASFHHANEPELRAYFTKRRSVPLDVVCRDLGFTEELLRKAASVQHTVALSDAEIERIIHAVVGSKKLREEMISTSAEKRRRLFAYFESMGVFANDQMTLVDLGWGGTIQRTLANVFRTLERPSHIRGLYLATHEKLLELPLDSCSADSFLFHLGRPEASATLLRRTPEILEHACMPEVGSFMGIDEAGAIVTFPQNILPQQLHEISELQRGIMHFADHWLPGSAQRRKQVSHADYQAVLARLRAILARSLHQPTVEEVELFAAWDHDPNDGSSQCERLLGDEELRRRARFMNYYQILELSWLDCYWPQALARLAGKSNEDTHRLWKTALRYQPVRASADFFSRSAEALSRLLVGR